MGVGFGSGDNRTQDAVHQAISSPLLETSIEGATDVIINFTGGVDLGALEVYDAADVVREAVDPDANIIVGAVIDETLNEEIRITVIATGFEVPNNNIAPSEVINKVNQIQREEAPQPKTPTPEVAATVEQPKQENNFDDDDLLDIPVFLRRTKKH